MVSCATIEVPQIRPGITLPASGDGIQVDTLTGEVFRTPKAEWEQKLPRGITIFSDDWAKLKNTILKNCMANTCEQAVGYLDSLFQTIDGALKRLPSPTGL